MSQLQNEGNGDVGEANSLDARKPARQTRGGSKSPTEKMNKFKLVGTPNSLCFVYSSIFFSLFIYKEISLLEISQKIRKCDRKS